MKMVELLKGAMVCKTNKNKKDTNKAKKRQKRTTAIKQINKKKTANEQREKHGIHQFIIADFICNMRQCIIYSNVLVFDLYLHCGIVFLCQFK